MGGGGVNPQSLDSPIDHWVEEGRLPDHMRAVPKPGE